MDERDFGVADAARGEAELRRLRPAPVPAALTRRLQNAVAVARPAAQEPSRARLAWPVWLTRWPWPLAATPVAAAAVALVWAGTAGRLDDAPRSPGAMGIKASAVELDRNLVSSFDAVAELPSGEPVRFRCRQWRDDLVLRDATHGLVIEQSNPRLEVVPVRLETY